MLTGEVNVPPIVKELVGDDKLRLAVAVKAYFFLWRHSCGENGDLIDEFENLLAESKNSWLEQSPELGGLTPLAIMRKAIEEEKRKLMDRGLDP